MINVPPIIKIHSKRFNLKRKFEFSKPNIKSASMIIPIEQIIGAITGPIQGKGIKNKISQVKNDEGQFRNNLRAT